MILVDLKLTKIENKFVTFYQNCIILLLLGVPIVVLVMAHYCEPYVGVLEILVDLILVNVHIPRKNI